MRVNSLKDLPCACRKNKLTLLKQAVARGTPLSEFTQEERDLLHMETSRENAEYWKEEKEKSETDERAHMCESIRLSIITHLYCAEKHAEESEGDAERDGFLCGILEEADNLPATH